MQGIRVVFAEIIGLFVDDGSLAIALVIWCAVIGAIVMFAPGLPVAVPAAALLAGCVSILLVNVIRAARKRWVATA